MNAQRSDITITIRAPRELHAQLVALAEREDRSMSAEIVRLLRYVVPIAEKNPI